MDGARDAYPAATARRGKGHRAYHAGDRGEEGDSARPGRGRKAASQAHKGEEKGTGRLTLERERARMGQQTSEHWSRCCKRTGSGTDFKEQRGGTWAGRSSHHQGGERPGE